MFLHYGCKEEPKLDGYGSMFFKATWPIIGDDMMKAIHAFFLNGCMLTQVNTTTLAMIPKILNREISKDLRPIACCNTIYKCITKLICNTLKLAIPKLINEAQGAFV